MLADEKGFQHWSKVVILIIYTFNVSTASSTAFIENCIFLEVHPQKGITGQVKITFLPKENLLGKKVAEIFCDKQSADTDRSKVQIFHNS